MLKIFEIFIHSRGLHKHTSLKVQPHFTILDAEDKDILDYLMFKKTFPQEKPGYTTNFVRTWDGDKNSQSACPLHAQPILLQIPYAQAYIRC